MMAWMPKSGHGAGVLYRSIRPYGRGKSKSWSFVPYLIMYMFSHCGLTAEVNQGRGASPHTRPRRTARPILLGFSKTPLTELKAPWAFSVLMLSRQTLVPDSTDAISASMPRSRNEHKCPAVTPRGGGTSVVSVLAVNLERVSPVLFFCTCSIFLH